MKIQTDQEILTNLLNQLKTNRNENDLTTILTDLEFYLHQVRTNFKQKKIFLNHTFFSMITQYISPI